MDMAICTGFYKLRFSPYLVWMFCVRCVFIQRNTCSLLDYAERETILRAADKDPKEKIIVHTGYIDKMLYVQCFIYFYG